MARTVSSVGRWRVLIALSFLVALASTPTFAKKRPVKRDYSTHTYYVLELDPDQLPLGEAGSPSPEDIATALGAEHVEQVGELEHHYLIRAPNHIVQRGEHSWFPRLEKRGNAAAAVSGSARERDLVLERYDLLRRRARGKATVLQKRSLYSGSEDMKERRRGLHAAMVHSLERQYPSKRVKREYILSASDFDPPSSLLLKRDTTSPIPLKPYRRTPQSGKAIYNPDRKPPPPQEPSVSSPTLVQDMATLLGIEDPLWDRQWHLVNGIIEANSINVTGVWRDGVHGKGINVAIVDDGLDMHSDDLAPNFHAEGSWDYNDNTALPEPRLSDDQHGTRCAGEVAAAKNDVCGVGVAYESGIAGIRILSASISDADEASALNYGYQSNDIYSCSWGPPDDGKSMEAPGRLIVKAMLNGVQNGRQGKGSIFVFASGNGGANDDQCNFDGYTNSLMSITVGAIDRKGLHPFYSEACAAIMVVTYSSGSGDSIHTTDVGKQVCTDRHGGTSAAAPIAAGIFALVLQVRPDLTWRDMQHLCVLTAVQVNPLDPDWQMTAVGRKFNHKYGFGKLDAWAMVEAAKTWKLVKPQVWWTSPVVQSRTAITSDGTTATIEVTKEDLEDANFELLEHVTVTVHIEHARRGNIEVELDSPRGMKSILARPRRMDESGSGMPDWTFMTVKHWDEDPIGTWTLRVKDRQDNGKNGTFNSWSMQLWGSAIDASKAKPWKIPRPPHGVDPEADAEEDEATTTTSLPTPTAEGDDDSTKYVKPTVHLPDDHKEAEGEAHSSFGEPAPPTPTDVAEDEDDEYEDVPTLPEGAPEPTRIGEADPDYYDEDSPGYLAGMSRLLKSSTWLFVAGGTVVVFIAGVSAFFIMRRRPGRGRIGRGGGYEFAPSADEEDGLPMSAMGRGGALRLGDGSGRTKELYDAFALEGSDSEESDDEGAGPKSRVRTDIAYKDEAMASFLDDPETPLAAGQHPIHASRGDST